MSESIFRLTPGWMAASVLAIAIEVVAPLVIAVVLRRRLRVGWRWFWSGALIFVLFQLLTRVPAVQVAQLTFGDRIAGSPILSWGWLIVLAFSAGVFEEIGRWIGYRWLFRPEQRQWREGVMYGLGHGGIESMVLVGGSAALSLASLIALNGVDLETQLSPEQLVAARSQLSLLAAQPDWYPLLGAWERLSALALHIGLSLIVLRAFLQRSWAWLSTAIVIHGAVNFVAVALLRLLGAERLVLAGVAVEVVIALMATATLVAGLRLHLRAPPLT